MENSEIIVENEAIVNKSDFTNKEIIDALTFLTGKSKNFWIFMLIFGLGSIVLYFLEFFKDVRGILLGCGIFIVVISLLMMFGLPFLMKRNNNNFKDGVSYEYSFYNDEFKVETILTGQTSSAVVKYDSLFKTMKKDNYLYIYISKAQCYILKLNGFVNEEDKKEVLKKLNAK